LLQRTTPLNVALSEPKERGDQGTFGTKRGLSQVGNYGNPRKEKRRGLGEGVPEKRKKKARNRRRLNRLVNPKGMVWTPLE